MSAPLPHAAHLRDAAAAAARAAVALDKHRSATRAQSGHAAAKAAQIQSHKIAVALGDAGELDGPDAGELVAMQAALAMAPEIESRLQARLSAAQAALATAERSHKTAIAHYMETTAVAPARDDLRRAFDGFRDAAVKLMAAHNLAYRKFNDRAPPAQSVNEFFGPAAVLLAAMHAMPWDDYPYSIRPGWLPMHGKFWADELPGVADEMTALLAKIEQEEAA